MRVTRRETCCLLTAAAARAAVAAPQPWSPEWDRALILAAVEQQDPSFDPRESMLMRRVGGEYHYHTGVRREVVHPTRDSLAYALLLLEAGRAERALKIIERMAALQETDPGSKWYGLWGYYLEEPAPKMSPADWNWADFNGALLLLIEARHRKQLPEPLRRGVLEAIRHAAYSVRRRNVTMTYTNIAVQGTFVTLAAAELLGDKDLEQYALDRLHRFARAVDETGSFAEYNSPTYTQVTITNLTRMRMVVRNRAALELVERIHERAWLHLGRHWHPPTRQLAGPMSRCYSTDIGSPLWLQKALGGRLAFATLEEIREKRAPSAGETGMLDYRCPAQLAPLFLKLAAPRQHRELFLPAQPPMRPVQGTTLLERHFSLGSANRGDLWIQRRPLLAYWGGLARPARYLQLRFMKDDYDFASALFFSAQERNFVLGLVNFRSPGGDKHGNLDPIQNAEFMASRLRLVFELAGAPAEAGILADGKPASGELPLTAGVTVALGGGTKLWVRPRTAVFGERTARWSVEREGTRLLLSLDLLRSQKQVLVRWADVKTAYAAFTLAMEHGGGAPAEFDRRSAACAFEETRGAGTTRLAWKTHAGELGLNAGTEVATAERQNQLFSETLNGQLIPVARLSEARLAPDAI
ncbi:MAG: hypothetical protein AAB225_11940 [Acidobacteriota bacterium]